MNAQAPGQAALPPLPPKWTGKFRKRPVVVDAVQLTHENAAEVWRWVAPAVKIGQALDVTIDIDKGLTVKTLEGDIRAPFGDWIIKDIQGKFYPCKPGIFAAMYELAEAAIATQQPSPASDLEAAFASGARVRTGSCTVDAHDREHFQVRTNGRWLCGLLLASLLIAQGIVADPAPQLHDAAEREMDLYRNEITRLTGQRDEARADRDDYASRLRAADESWTRLAVERDKLRERVTDLLAALPGGDAL